MKKQSLAKEDRNKSHYWSNRINSLWRKTANAYIEMGLLLHEAKETLKTSDWKRMLDELDFDDSKGDQKVYMLMKIGSSTPLTKESNLRLLPPNLTTLYTLAKLDDKDLGKLIKEGHVTNNMSRSDAEELTEKVKPKAKAEPKRMTISDDVDEAEVVDEDSEDNESDEDEDEDDEPAPKKLAKLTVVKGSLEQAQENFLGGIESLRFFAENFEAQLDKVDKPLSRKVIDEIESLVKLLTRFAKDQS